MSALILQFGTSQEKAKDFGVNGTFPNLFIYFVIYFVSALILQFGLTQEKAKDYGVNGTFPNLFTYSCHLFCVSFNFAIWS